MSIRHDMATYQESTLADQAMRLLLHLACGFALYGLGLFLTLATGPGLFQAVGIIVTLFLALRCIFLGLEIYRLNKLMRQLCSLPSDKN